MTAIAKMAQPGRGKMLPAGWGWEHNAICLLKRGMFMSNIKQLTDVQIRELLSKPYSDENAKQLSEVAKTDCWLLARNFSENSSVEMANISQCFKDPH